MAGDVNYPGSNFLPSMLFSLCRATSQPLRRSGKMAIDKGNTEKKKEKRQFLRNALAREMNFSPANSFHKGKENNSNEKKGIKKRKKEILNFLEKEMLRAAACPVQIRPRRSVM
jgi:hypothetical protein